MPPKVQKKAAIDPPCTTPSYLKTTSSSRAKAAAGGASASASGGGGRRGGSISLPNSRSASLSRPANPNDGQYDVRGMMQAVALAQRAGPATRSMSGRAASLDDLHAVGLASLSFARRAEQAERGVRKDVSLAEGVNQETHGLFKNIIDASGVIHDDLVEVRTGVKKVGAGLKQLDKKQKEVLRLITYHDQLADMVEEDAEGAADERHRAEGAWAGADAARNGAAAEHAGARECAAAAAAAEQRILEREEEQKREREKEREEREKERKERDEEKEREREQTKMDRAAFMALVTKKLEKAGGRARSAERSPHAQSSTSRRVPLRGQPMRRSGSASSMGGAARRGGGESPTGRQTQRERREEVEDVTQDITMTSVVEAEREDNEIDAVTDALNRTLLAEHEDVIVLSSDEEGLEEREVAVAPVENRTVLVEHEDVIELSSDEEGREERAVAVAPVEVVMLTDDEDGETMQQQDAADEAAMAAAAAAATREEERAGGGAEGGGAEAEKEAAADAERAEQKRAKLETLGAQIVSLLASSTDLMSLIRPFGSLFRGRQAVLDGIPEVSERPRVKNGGVWRDLVVESIEVVHKEDMLALEAKGLPTGVLKRVFVPEKDMYRIICLAKDRSVAHALVSSPSWIGTRMGKYAYPVLRSSVDIGQLGDADAITIELYTGLMRANLFTLLPLLGAFQPTLKDAENSKLIYSVGFADESAARRACLLLGGLISGADYIVITK